MKTALLISIGFNLAFVFIFLSGKLKGEVNYYLKSRGRGNIIKYDTDLPVPQKNTEVTTKTKILPAITQKLRLRRKKFPQV